MPSRRILIIAYHFPPDAAVGALRPLKFAKYLPLYGWEPYVLTVKPSYYQSLDQSRMDEVPSQSRVFRTAMLPHPNTVYKYLKESYYKVTGRKKEFSRKLLESPSEGHPNSHRMLGSTRKFLGSLLWIPPDDVLGWLPIAVLKGIRLLRAHHITHIYTTNPPHTTHLVGLAIKTICNVKWVADFRDIWLFEKPFQTRMAERLEHWMERKVVENADAIALTTDRMADKFRQTYSAENATKFVTIYNGYDAEDFSSILPAAAPRKFTLTYIGSFYDERTPEHLLIAVAELVARQQIPADALEIQLIGNCRYVKGRSTNDMAVSLGLSSVVRVIDPVPYRRALEYAVNSHLLVLLAPDQPYEIPGKAYEYLASGTDVLALTQEGATADLIRKTGGGAVVEPQDILGIKSAVLERYVKWAANRSGIRSRPATDARMYERRELTRKLVSILDPGA
jgi:Glycosyl transferase 4-like domain/Glycosyl transferases group 1